MVLNGIDVLERDGFAVLRGQRIGLVTNHTGLTADGRAAADVLHAEPSVQLTALFGPEHGIRGLLDEDVPDAVDAATGLPVYSLYGERRQPSAEQLAGVDTLVFDIQDIGCRFYTYISTLGNVLEAAGKHGKRVVVLDRANPITGGHVEGPIADKDKLAFVAYHDIPVRHGMTVGEIARLFNVERGFGCDLEVVRCDGWCRGDWFDETGLVWTNPSPNMRSLMQATLYPGVGLLEMTNVSVGRGMDTPFEVVGAPYIDPRAFAEAVNAAGAPGVRFIPVSFTPSRSVFANEACGGVNLLIVDRDAFDAVRTGLTLAIMLRRLYPEQWQPEKLMTLLVNQAVYDGIIAGDDYDALRSTWGDDLAAFVDRREGVLIYG
jgi:uncharacterized protein YbbC (DUF1343 family)